MVLFKQVEKIKKDGGVAAIGLGIDSAGRRDLAQQKAMLDGRLQIAQIFALKMQNLQKKFVEEVGSTSKAEINEMFSNTTKQLTKTTLNGSQALSLPLILIDRKDSNKITVKIVVGIDPKTLNSAVLAELKNAGPNLYERFRASQAGKELNEEMENYEKAGS
jgi:hypothetical protein